MKKFLQRFYLTLILLLLYAPIITLVVLSFNNSKTRAKWGGFTGKWYVSLFHNEEIMNALFTTLTIALLSAVIATLIGTLAAIGLNALNKKFRSFAMGVTNIPMLNADIVTGISLMLLFIALRFSLGFTTILLAHITFNIPYVILSVMPKLKQINIRSYEAAQDLGASRFYAFRAVVLPDLFPGISSGFLLAFTMSLDDFIITHFTKGPGVDTLSTKIYSEVRKGIKPEMYALSTLLFVTILILLLLINLSPKEKSENSSKKVRKTMHLIQRRIIPGFIAVLFIVGGVYYGRESSGKGNEQVIVYNWGEYMDPEVLTLFTKETDIDVVYEEFETNEIMYPKISSGAIPYDVVCPSDYMIQKMIENNLLAKLDYSKIPNSKYIDPTYMEQSKQFDKTNEYSIPYCWGTVGILYNKTKVTEPVDSWSILWNPKYANEILMQDSVRDAFGITLKSLGYSLNSTDLDELQEAKDALIKQKPLVQAYVVDQVRDKMIGGEASLGVIYSGEALYTQSENKDLEYVIPKEGSNVWIDSWVIPKNAKNKENAEAFINFLCKPEIAKMNFDYITYSTPNMGARALIEDEKLRNSKVAFPSAKDLENCETFQYIGDKYDALYNELWREVKGK